MTETVPIPRGSEVLTAKLTEADIPIIRQMHGEGRSLKEIAERFGVTQQNIRAVVTGKTWKHVTTLGCEKPTDPDPLVVEGLDRTPSAEPVAINFDSGHDWNAAQGDCVHLMRTMPENSIHLTVTSIPFSALLTYSASDYDFGNCRNDDEFFSQFEFFAKELLRVTIPGRIAAIHCMLLPSSKTRDGFIGLKDFRGDVVRAFQKAGWIFHSETAIRKCPVTAVQRTKALGLLHKQLRKDSTMSRTGINDYLCAFRKPGTNPEPVSHTAEEYPVSKWQQVAEPVWLDIDQTETLQARAARDDDDAAHLCPLQTQVIERCVELWSNTGDVVFDPFGGIGSTSWVALRMNRKAVAHELKTSYFEQLVKNLKTARKQLSILDALGAVQ